MGCGSSNSRFALKQEKTKFERKDHFLKTKSIFENLQQHFREEVMSKAFMDDLDNLEKNQKTNFKKALNNLWNQYIKIFHEAGIHRKDFDYLIMHLIGENILKSKFSYQEDEITKLMHKFLEGKLNFLPANDKSKVMSILLGINLERFPKLSKSFIYCTESIKQDLHDYWRTINDNLKFNPDFKINTFTIILTPWLLNREDIIEDLCSYLEFNENLYIMNILISNSQEKSNDPFNLNAKSYACIFKILASVKSNTNIKILFFHCDKSLKTSLPPEIYGLILDKIKDDGLIALHLGKFILSEEFCDKLFEGIKLSKNLLYFGFDNKLPKLELVNSLKETFLTNISLIAVLISGLKLENELEVLKNLKATPTLNDNIKLFHYENNINLV